MLPRELTFPTRWCMTLRVTAGRHYYRSEAPYAIQFCRTRLLNLCRRWNRRQPISTGRIWIAAHCSVAMHWWLWWSYRGVEERELEILLKCPQTWKRGDANVFLVVHGRAGEGRGGKRRRRKVKNILRVIIAGWSSGETGYVLFWGSVAIVRVAVVVGGIRWCGGSVGWRV